MTDGSQPQPEAAGCPNRRLLLLLIAATLLIRIGVLVVVPSTFVDDPDGYRAVAVNLVEYGCFGTGNRPIATRPPLYPLVVAICRVIDPALWYSLATLHVALGVATVVLTYHLACRWGVGRWSLLAAGLVAVDPILLLHSTLVMTETLATFLAVAGLLAITQCADRPTAGRAALVGALMALAVLCRPTFLVSTALIVILLPLAAEGGRNRAKLFATLIVSTLAVSSPWMIRNAVRFGRPTPATNHGGFTLLLANNASFYDYLRTAQGGEVWDADPFNQEWSARARRLAPGDEVAADRLAYADAFAVIRSQPRTFAYACLVHVTRLWGVMPHRTAEMESPLRRAARWLIGAFYVAESILAVLGLLCVFRGRVPRHRLFRGWVWGLILLAGFTTIHTFYWTNLRMRAPLIPVVCTAAAVGAGWIRQRRVRVVR